METVSRRGYRFIGQTEPESAAKAVAVEDEGESSREGKQALKLGATMKHMSRTAPQETRPKHTPKEKSSRHHSDNRKPELIEISIIFQVSFRLLARSSSFGEIEHRKHPIYWSVFVIE